VVELDVSWLRCPDLRSVDALARLQLAAGRSGCSLRLRGLRPAVTEVLELTGLWEVVCRSTADDPGRWNSPKTPGAMNT
jgi:hypothetical protein